MINPLWTGQAWDDYLYWEKTDKAKLKRINDLIDSIKKTPFTGIGKPEPLKFQLAGYWSRRINTEHRLVYKYERGIITIVSCRYHT